MGARGLCWGACVSLALGCRSAPAPGPVDDPPARLLAVLDQDGDGTLSSDELARVAHPDLQLEDWDGDGDGRLDAHELRLLLYGVSPLAQGHRGAEEEDEAGSAAREAADRRLAPPAGW